MYAFSCPFGTIFNHTILSVHLQPSSKWDGLATTYNGCNLAWKDCSTSQPVPRIGLYTASVVSLKDALTGWRACDCDAPIQLLRIQINTGNTVPSPTWHSSPTWRKQKAFPFTGAVALWVFCKKQWIPYRFQRPRTVLCPPTWDVKQSMKGQSLYWNGTLSYEMTFTLCAFKTHLPLVPHIGS